MGRKKKNPDGDPQEAVKNYLKGTRTRMMIAWIIFLLALLALTAVMILRARGIFFNADRYGMGRQAPRRGEVTYCSYVRSGDSLGSRVEYRMERRSDGSADIFVEKQEAANARVSTTKRHVSKALVSELSSYVRDHAMTQWRDLKPAEIQALDAASASVRFTVDGVSYTFSDTDELPEPGAPEEIRDILENYFSPER